MNTLPKFFAVLSAFLLLSFTHAQSIQDEITAKFTELKAIGQTFEGGKSFGKLTFTTFYDIILSCSKTSTKEIIRTACGQLIDWYDGRELRQPDTSVVTPQSEQIPSIVVELMPTKWTQQRTLPYEDWLLKHRNDRTFVKRRIEGERNYPDRIREENLEWVINDIAQYLIDRSIISPNNLPKVQIEYRHWNNNVSASPAYDNYIDYRDGIIKGVISEFWSFSDVVLGIIHTFGYINGGTNDAGRDLVQEIFPDIKVIRTT